MCAPSGAQNRCRASAADKSPSIVSPGESAAPSTPGAGPRNTAPKAAPTGPPPGVAPPGPTLAIAPAGDRLGGSSQDSPAGQPVLTAGFPGRKPITCFEGPWGRTNGG